MLKFSTVIMNNIISLITLFTLLFCGVNSIFSQEWEAVYHSDEIVSGCDYLEAMELSNGYVLVSSLNYPLDVFASPVNLTNAIHSTQPTLSLISPDGEELYRKVYFKHGLCETTTPYLFEKNGEMYFLTSYSPDHDFESKNYFKNYDSIPTESIIGLYKLDEMLNVTEAYEYTYPIDTFEIRNEEWYMYRNVYSGYIHIYSAFEDDGYITGVYSKMSSVSHEERHDSVFFFKMDFNGDFLLRKGYEAGCGTSIMACKRQQMVKNENGYAVYYRGCPDYHGIVEYYDDDFNYMATRDVLLPGDYSPILDDGMLDQFSVMRSDHNTTYVCSNFEGPGNGINDEIRLYEIDDDLNNSTEPLPVLNYIERKTPEHDRTSTRSMDMTKDGDIYFTYTLNCALDNDNDSWIMIEKLDTDFDTIATFFYDEVGVFNMATCVTTTKDDGLLLVSYSYDMYNHNDRWSKVSKFPASAFVNIEEAHVHNLHLAVAYPNPGGDVLNIRTGLRNGTLQVYDIQGRIIHQQIITDEVTSVDASKWNSGTYIWKLTVNNELLTVEEGKWIK